MKALADVRQVDDPAELRDATDDVIWYPDLAGTQQGLPRPYVLGLSNATFYPHADLAGKGGETPDPSPAPLPKGLSRKTLGLVVTGDGALLPDSFGKSRYVPAYVAPTDDGRWSLDLPTVSRRHKGTYLFAELFYGHFGHTLTDMPSRLWPIGAGLLSAGDLDGVIGAPNMGAGRTPDRLPRPAQDVLRGIGVPFDKVIYDRAPVSIDRLILPCRLAPYMGPWHRVVGDMMRRVGGKIAQGVTLPDTPDKIWLSRSRLDSDSRGGPGLAALDDLFAERGFAVIHPQDLPFDQQVALLRGASHVAGPVGSQLHLCAFMTRPGAKVLTIGPSYFKLDINLKYLSGVDGTETHYLLDLPNPGGRRHKAAWAFDPAETPRLMAILDDWQD